MTPTAVHEHRLSQQALARPTPPRTLQSLAKECKRETRSYLTLGRFKCEPISRGGLLGNSGEPKRPSLSAGVNPGGGLAELSSYLGGSGRTHWQRRTQRLPQSVGGNPAGGNG